MRNYEAPKLSHIGSVESLTAGASDGSQLDDTFPVHTPKDQLTFS